MLADTSDAAADALQPADRADPSVTDFDTAEQLAASSAVTTAAAGRGLSSTQTTTVVEATPPPPLIVDEEEEEEGAVLPDKVRLLTAQNTQTAKHKQL